MRSEPETAAAHAAAARVSCPGEQRWRHEAYAARPLRWAAYFIGQAQAQRGARHALPSREESHMLDIAFIRENPELVKDVARRRKTAVDVDALLALDSELRTARRRADDLRG